MASTITGFLRRLSTDSSFSKGENSLASIAENVGSNGDKPINNTSNFMESIRSKNADFFSNISSTFDNIKRRTSLDILSINEEQNDKDSNRKEKLIEIIKTDTTDTTNDKKFLINETSTTVNTKTDIIQRQASDTLTQKNKPPLPRPPPPNLDRRKSQETANSAETSNNDVVIQNFNLKQKARSDRCCKITSCSDDEQSSASEYGDVGDAPCYDKRLEDKQQLHGSNVSLNSLGDDLVTSSRIQIFISTYLEKLFTIRSAISSEEKSQFGKFCQHHTGRSQFGKEMRRKSLMSPGVAESIFYALVQHFAIVLYECNEAEDFMLARQLMKLSFTFYTTVTNDDNISTKLLLHNHLKDQTIWRSSRFWNAVFFNVMLQERAKIADNIASQEASLTNTSVQVEEKTVQEKFVMNQLSQFINDMKLLNLSTEFCLEFLKKQGAIAELQADQIHLLKESIQKRETV